MRKDKKGFTLVELLAVISILAILVILALPQVLAIFTTSKKDAFLTQARSVFKAAEQRYMTDQMKPGMGAIITYCDTNLKIDLQGNSVVTYKIKFNADGKIVYFAVKDASYSVIKTAGATGVSSEEIVKDDVISPPENFDSAVTCST